MFTTQWQGESTTANFFCVSCLWIGPLILWIHMVISCYEWSHCVDSVWECDLCERRAVQGCFLLSQQSRHDDEQAEEAAEFAQEHKHTQVQTEYTCAESSGASSRACFLWFHLSTSILSLFCLFVPSVLSCFCVFLLSGVLYLSLWSVGFVCLCAHFTLTFWMLYLFLGNFGRPSVWYAFSVI